jgi:5-methylcytosine-specific restriction protein B
MPALGLGEADLDAAFDADSLDGATQALRNMTRMAAQSGNAPFELVGNTTNARMRISNVASAVRNYRQFREAENQPTSAWPALDDLRAGFIDAVPEFERFTVADNEYERIERAYKNVMAAKTAEIIQSDVDDETAGRRIYRALIPNEGPLLSWQTDDAFARKHPEFAPAFYAAIGALARDTGPAADAIMTAGQAFAELRRQGASALTPGELWSVAITVAGMTHPRDAAPFKIGKARSLAKLLTDDPIFRGDAPDRDQLDRWLNLLSRIEEVMRDQWLWEPRDLIDVQGFAWMALNGEATVIDDEAVLAHFDSNATFRAAREEWTADQTSAFCTIASAAHEAGFDWWHVNINRSPCRFGRKAAGRKNAQGVQGYLELKPSPRIWFNEPNLSVDLGIRHVLFDQDSADDFADRLTQRSNKITAWKPPVPARSALWPDQAEDEQTSGDSLEPEERVMVQAPVNLILYGPPGTGKTYATAVHAVELCGESAPADRGELMALYRALAEAGRIEFVTFHQSIAYEEFVEGLRPVQILTSEEGQVSTGFSLEPQPGIFRRIARRAETSTGPGKASFALGDRQVFKMSLGDASDEGAAWVFEEAIAEKRIILGFEDIDWSDPKYASRDEIMAACQANESAGRTLNAQSAVVQMPNIFRNWMHEGDVVIVTKGNKLFRAIGIITGGYRFAPREGGDYGHQRDVEWLWVDRVGVPVEEIYTRGFSMRTTYEMTRSDLKIPALERYANSQRDAGTGTPEPFVLVIDEINRANISKVFGELITLLESDKRLGAPNELKVRLPYSGEMFGVPANLHIVGTMNTADRSIALLDTALRRRFTFEELAPRPDLLGTIDGIDLGLMLATLNERIEYLFDREHRIGHAYLMGCGTREDLDDVVCHRLIPLLAEYFYEDWGKVAAVMGDVFADDGKAHQGTFIDRQIIASPFAMSDDGDGRTRYRWIVRDVDNFNYVAFQ